MSNQLAAVEKEHKAALDELSALQKSQEWEMMKAAADAAGIVDPTPTSDVISGIMSAVEGDVAGVLLSAVSVIPWIGDAIGKPAKAARMAKKLEALREAFTKAAKRLDALADPLKRHKEAAKRTREARRQAVGGIEECKRTGRWGDGVQLPTTGSWKPPNSKGHGTWTSDDGRYTVPYKEGYPDFTRATGPKNGAIVQDTVEIPMKGKNGPDFAAADAAMRAKHGDSWSMPDKYTWHHSEDGATMVLVRSDVHDKSISRGGSGAAHGGGASIARSEEF